MDSHHPLQHKLGVIRTLIHRAESLVTDQDDKLSELEKIKTDRVRTMWLQRGPTSLLPSPNTRSDRLMTLTDHQYQSFYRAPVHSRCIQRTATHPRQTWCSGSYNASYIAETKRNLSVRAAEHRGERSPVADHAKPTRHNIALTPRM